MSYFSEQSWEQTLSWYRQKTLLVLIWFCHRLSDTTERCALNRRFIILHRSFYQYICWFKIRWESKSFFLFGWVHLGSCKAQDKKHKHSAAVRRSSTPWMFYSHINKAAYHPSDYADKHTHPLCKNTDVLAHLKVLERQHFFKCSNPRCRQVKLQLWQ